MASIALTPIAPSGVPGEQVQLTATVRDAGGNTLPDRTVTWTSADLAKATVDAAGLVTAVAVGSATVQATSEAKSRRRPPSPWPKAGSSGPAGGTVTGFAGSVALDVPAGAVAAPVAVRLSRRTRFRSTLRPRPEVRYCSPRAA